MKGNKQMETSRSKQEDRGRLGNMIPEARNIQETPGTQTFRNVSYSNISMGAIGVVWVTGGIG